ncbi:MAG: STAS domain-containing protein [Gammaproteobacteria bacterium]|nr:STAS domain-containing protein [Gammaproteobacteria bacterium]
MTAAFKQQDGQLKLAGVLDFHSVADLLKGDQSWLQGDQISIDLTEITQTNSAGLALLLEWMKMAQQKGLQIKYHSVPEQLLVIARAYGVDQDLPIV